MIDGDRLRLRALDAIQALDPGRRPQPLEDGADLVQKRLRLRRTSVRRQPLGVLELLAGELEAELNETLGAGGGGRPVRALRFVTRSGEGR